MNSKYNYTVNLAEDNSAGTLILRRIKPGSKVLEFGPATGYMTRYMQEELGCKVYCVEIDPEAAREASRFCEKMIVADLELMEWGKELTPGFFDYLIFADVLEHLKDPWTVLQYALGFLNQGGSVITSIPNIGHSAVLMELLRGNFAYRSLGILDNTHLRFFTRRSVLDLLERTGLYPVEWLSTVLVPEETEFHNGYIDFPLPVQRALQNKEDAHVYQFVTVSKRKEDAAPAEGVALKTTAGRFANGYLQVYWEVEGHFDEIRSVKAAVSTEDGQHVYEINLPPEAGGRLRLDPVNYPAYVEIESIILYGKSGNEDEPVELQSWNASSGMDGIELGSGVQQLESKEKYRLAFISTDPQLVLTPRGLYPAGKLLRVSMRVSHDVYGTMGQEIHLLRSQAADLRQSLSKQGEELENTKNKAAERQMQLDSIIYSHSWGVLNHIRRAAWLTRKLIMPLKAIFGIAFEQVLLPVSRLRPLPEEGLNVWEATARDPQFLLAGPWPKGWTEISWLASSDYPLRMRLYFDRGRGFNEMESLDLAVVSGEKLKEYKVLVPMGDELKAVRLDPGEGAGQFALEHFKMKGLSRGRIFLRAVKRFFAKQGVSYDSLSYFVRSTGGVLKRGGFRELWNWAKNLVMPGQDYELWLKYNILTPGDKQRIKQHIEKMNYKPVFSIVVPVYNVEEKWLRSCIDSVLNQLYPHWELCIADDASPDPRVHQVLAEYAGKDKRIKVVFREKNGHISAASNSALEIAIGEFIALLDNDDELSQDALYENAALLNIHPNADMIYSDEDKISLEGERHSPFFKPDWSPDNMLSQMYTCHFGVYRSKIIRDIGGFRTGFEGSQDHDLVLRFTERSNKIFHIPKILYHWRTVPQSTAMNPGSKSYATIAGEKAVHEALQRRGEGGWVESLDNYPGHYLVHYPPKGNPLISILIPTRDMAGLLGPCLESIFAKTTYDNYEVIVIDNGSTEAETFALFDRWREQEQGRFRVLRLDIPFNYSRLNNEGVREAKGELILLLNNDVEVITPNWLEEMAGQAMRPGIGAVGAKLLYSDQTIQHAGVTLGVRGVADHTHKGIDSDHPGYFGRLLIVTDVAAVTGACLMVKRKIFEAVGGLEEELEVAFNDVDFCLKVLETGVYNVALPHVKLFHYESKSRGYEDTPEKLARFKNEVSYVKEKWDRLLSNDPFYNPNLSLEKSDFSVAVRVMDRDVSEDA